MALGAKPEGVLAMVMQEGMLVVLIGLLTGIVLALTGAGLTRHLLYGSSSSDFQVYVDAALTVALIGLVACWIPAHRAASLDPLIALREE